MTVLTLETFLNIQGLVVAILLVALVATITMLAASYSKLSSISHNTATTNSTLQDFLTQLAVRSLKKNPEADRNTDLLQKLQDKNLNLDEAQELKGNMEIEANAAKAAGDFLKLLGAIAGIALLAGIIAAFLGDGDIKKKKKKSAT